MGSSIGVSELVERAKIIFWDFDGVIKESVDIKTRAFVNLFEPYGTDVTAKVKMHHEANGGMSRFNKLPLYLQWSGIEPNEELVETFSEKFSQLALRGVIEAEWVPGAETFLRTNKYGQIFILVSATPQSELDIILDELNITHVFSSVFGSPTTKSDAMSLTLKNLNIDPNDALMIGDALADMEASHANKVPFLLRRYSLNATIFSNYQGLFINDLAEL